MSRKDDSDALGCGILLAILLVIFTVVATVVSIAAVVDPFARLPPLGQIYACFDDDGCALGARYPRFWTYVLVNFAYAIVALGLVVVLARTIPEFREARAERFADSGAVERYRRARDGLTVVAVLLGALGAIPIVVALA